MPSDPAPQTPPAKTINNDTQASLPGRVRVQLWTWLRCFDPSARALFVLAGFGLLLSIAVLSVAGAKGIPLPLALLGFGIGWGRRFPARWLRIREHFVYGCLNPAQVVSVKPCLLAVWSDLSTSEPYSFPVIKILSQPLERARGRQPKVGDRVATVSVYFRNRGSRLPAWDDFRPIAVPCVTDDPRAVADAIARLDADADRPWDSLAHGLPQVPTPYRPGLYRLPSPTPVSFPEGAPTREK